MTDLVQLLACCALVASMTVSSRLSADCERRASSSRRLQAPGTWDDWRKRVPRFRLSVNDHYDDDANNDDDNDLRGQRQRLPGDEAVSSAALTAAAEFSDDDEA